MIRVADSYTVDASGLVLTKDGYLVGDAKIARAGNVQQYYGRELGLSGEDAGKVFGVYRDPDIVFNRDSMRSLAGRPITRNHPSEEVTSRNWKDLAKGSVGGVISREGEHVVASMAIMDAAAVEELQNNPGARALSAGYTVDISKEDGVAPDGTPYQYKQSGKLRFNHVAYLPGNNPRAGNTRIGDQGAPDIIYPAHMTKDEGGHMADLRKVIVDGLPVETTEAGETAINLLKTKVADAEKASATLVSDHAKAIAAKDAEIAKKDAEIDALKGKVMDAAALDAAVTARADLIATAKKVADQDYTGKSESEIRKMAVAKRFGDEAVANKSDSYIEARFDIAVADAAQSDPVRDAFKGNNSNVVNLGDAAAIEAKSYQAYLSRHDRKKEA